ncbi:hypothetical protein [Klebsiella variicola]|uniref:hypothetical protein n=1 Tax=Klebsiella variicola TaxID=244366 RepID=UPI00101D5E99|nr:hypothetical protein [Klebsiella variicola]
MTLLEILIQELPKRGGWDEKWHQCAQDGNGEVCFFTSGKIHFRGFFDTWSIPTDSVAQHDGKARIEALLADDYAETIITREQYEAALAAEKDSWITWGGGERPVNAYAIVDAMFRYKKVVATNIADCWRWNHNGTDSDIIAYRLHKPVEQQLPSEEVPIWNGEGLPPVGCECQYRKYKKSEQSEWFNGVVKYASEFTVVIQPVCYPGETVGHPANFEFRKISSEADMKREELAKALHIAAGGAVPVGRFGIEPLYLELADQIIAGEIPHLKIV